MDMVIISKDSVDSNEEDHLELASKSLGDGKEN